MGKSNRFSPEGQPKNKDSRKGSKSLGEQLEELGDHIKTPTTASGETLPTPKDTPIRLGTEWKEVETKDTPSTNHIKTGGVFYPTRSKHLVPKIVDGEIKPPQGLHTPEDKAVFELAKQLLGNKLFSPEDVLDIFSALEKESRSIQELQAKLHKRFYSAFEKRKANEVISSTSLSKIILEEEDELLTLMHTLAERKPNKEKAEQLVRIEALLEAYEKHIANALSEGHTPQEKDPPAGASEPIMEIPRYFKFGQIFLLPQDHTSEEAHWKVVALHPKTRSMTLKQVDGEQEGRQEEFHFGPFREFLSELQLKRQRAEWQEKNKAKKSEPTATKTSGPSTVAPAVLHPASPEPKPSFMPVRDLFTMFNKKNGHSVKGIQSWKKKWVDSGDIDTYREQFSNIAISNEQLEDAKSSLSQYIELLENDAISSNTRNSIVTSIGILARILAGVHHPTENDIEYYVKNNILSGPNARALSEHINGIVKAATTSSPVSPGPAPTTAHTPNPTIAPVPAPTATPSPSPAAAPQAPLREYDSWPTTAVAYKPSTKGFAGGWFSVKRNELLNEQEAWSGEHEAFKIVFKKYLDFIKSLSSEDRRRARPLIETKNKLLDAIKNENIYAVESLREELEETLDEWKERWKILDKIRVGEKKFEDTKKVIKKNESSLESHLASELQKKSDELEKIFNDLKNLVVANGLTEEEMEFLAKKADAYLKLAGEAEVQLSKKQESEKNNPVLRPIRATGAARDHKIAVPGKPPTTVGARQDELEAENRKKAYEKDVNDTGSRAEVRQKFEKMLSHDQNGFLALYTTPHVDLATNKIIYTSNDYLRKSPYRDVIKQVLFSNNIDVRDQSREEVQGANANAAEKEYLSRTRHGFSYNPSKEKDQHVSSTGGMVRNENAQKVPMATASVFGTINKYDELRAKVASVATPADEKKLDALKNQENEMGGRVAIAKERYNTSNEDVAHTKLKNAFDTYEKYANAFMAQKEKERSAAMDPQAKKEKQEALKKVNSVIEARIRNILKKADPKVSNMAAILSFAMAMGIGGGVPMLKYYSDHKEHTHNSVPEVVQKPVAYESSSAQEISQEHQEKVNDWKKFFHETNPKLNAFPDDIESLTTENLLRKYVPDLTANGDSATIERVLSMEAYKILHDTNEILELRSDKVREDLSVFLRLVEKVSQSINANERIATAKQGKLYNHPNDWFVTPTLSIRDYVNNIKAKAAQA